MILVLASLSYVYGESTNKVKTQWNPCEGKKGCIGTTMNWNITKTGIETSLEVRYEFLSETTTKFCVKFNNKAKYQNNLSLSGKDITKVPLTKLTKDFTINKVDIDLSKATETIEECFNVTYPEFKVNMSFEVGMNSVIVFAGTLSGALAPTETENLVRDSTGKLHATWRSGSDDIYYGNSTDDGATWTARELVALAVTLRSAGITVDSNDNLFISYVQSNNQVKQLNSTNSGGDWSSTYTIFDLVNQIQSQSSVIDSNDVQHFCILDRTDNLLYYGNSSNFDVEIPVDLNTSHTQNHCDIEVDSNNVPYIIGYGVVAKRDLDIWSPAFKGWGHNNRTLIEALNNLDHFDISISNDGKIYVSYETGSDLHIANGTTTGTDWTVTIVDTDFSQSTTSGVNDDGDVYVVYGNQSNLFFANSTNEAKTWGSRNQLLNLTGTAVSSLADTRFPSSNRMTDTVRYVFKNTTGYIFYDNFSIGVSDACTYGGSGDYEPSCADNCDEGTIDLGGNNVIITGTGTFKGNLINYGNLTVTDSTSCLAWVST